MSIKDLAKKIKLIVIAGYYLLTEDYGSGSMDV